LPTVPESPRLSALSGSLGLAVALGVVYYAIGNALRQAGGRDANYVRAEIRFGW
jgi:hypothetical protein